MLRAMSIVGLSLGLLFSALPAVACHDDAPASANLKKVSVDQLTTLLAQKPVTVAVYDANSPETRQKFGVIPSARLLSSYDSFDLKELPSDKNATLVFYCASERCTAAPRAAQRAVDNGYANVSVLEVGIKGWVGAGKEVSRPAA